MQFEGEHFDGRQAQPSLILPGKETRTVTLGILFQFNLLLKLKKSKAISVTDVTDVKDPTLSNNLLTVNCKILATCSSTYSPVRTSQEAHSVSIK
jgi:hypothetical protein